MSMNKTLTTPIANPFPLSAYLTENAQQDQCHIAGFPLLHEEKPKTMVDIIYIV
jgi:hypothetical protein